MEDSHCRELSAKLKTDFELKRKRLQELHKEVNELLNSHETKKIGQCDAAVGENEIRHENINSLICLRNKLDKMTDSLKAVHTEGSPEHIHLTSVHEKLILIHKTRETTTLNTSSDFQNLAYLVRDLQSQHQHNCQLKEEIENNINEAYRKVAKQQVLLVRRCSESSNPIDKENADRLLNDFVLQHINPQKLSLQDQKISLQKEPLQDCNQATCRKRLPLGDRNY